MKITDKLATGITETVTTNIEQKFENVLNEYSNTLRRDYNGQFELTIEDIKEATKGKKSIVVKSVYEETNPFYLQNIKTSTFRNILQKIEAKVLDDTKLRYGEDEIDFLQFEEGYSIVKKDLDNLFVKAVLNNRINIKGVVEGEVIRLVPIYNHEFKVEGDHIDFYIDKDIIERRYKEYTDIIKVEKDKETIIERTENPIKHLLFWSYGYEANIVSFGLIELILMYSETFSVLQKDINVTVATNFIDKQYAPKKNKLRGNYVPLEKPDFSLDASVKEKPLFEVLTPTSNINNYKEAKELLKEEISSLCQLDRSLLGFDSNTATSTRIASGQSIDTINRMKVMYADVINELLENITKTESYKYVIKEYYVKNEEILYNNISKAVQGGYMTIKEAVKKRSPEASEEEIEEEYLTLMYQRGIPFTSKEEERARKYGIMPEVEGGTILQ